MIIKSDLALIFEKGGEEGKQLFNALSVDKPLKIIVNNHKSNSAYLRGKVIIGQVKTHNIWIR